MLDGVALSFICAAKSHSFTKWFACLSELINHPLLHEEEKVLGIWLAIQSTKNESFCCSFNYAQISQAMQKSSRKIHRILTRLRIMGFFIADLPIYYGEPTPAMVHEMRTFKLMLPPKRQLAKGNDNAVVLPYIRSRPQITLNLIKRSKPTEQKKEEIKAEEQLLVNSLFGVHLLKKLFNIIADYLHFRRKRR